MEVRPLGRTGISVSVLGLGTVKIGRTQGVKYPSAYALPSDDDVRALLSCARDVGINLIDTAPAYGLSEERLGALLTGPRDSWVISTKAGEEFHDGTSHFDFAKPVIAASVERSLRRLRTDRVEVVLAHSDGLVEIDAPDLLAEAMVDLKRRGLAVAVGASTKTAQGARHAMGWADVVMLTLSVDNQSELPLVREASGRGIGVLIKKALNSGSPSLTNPPGEALHWAVETPGVSAVIVGTLSREHLRHNASALSRARGTGITLP